MKSNFFIYFTNVNYLAIKKKPYIVLLACLTNLLDDLVAVIRGMESNLSTSEKLGRSEIGICFTYDEARSARSNFVAIV
jgi:hypothetical protein